MIATTYTLEDTNGRFEVDVSDNRLNDIEAECFLADSLSEALIELKQRGYKCNRNSGFITKNDLYAMIWHDGFDVDEPVIVREWAKL